MEETKNNENQDEEKSIFDKVQDKFYEKRSDFESFILWLFVATVALMFFGLLASSVFNNLFLYLSLPFSVSLLITAISATTYFFAALYFRKRTIEKSLEKPKTFKEKCFKFVYKAIKLCIGFSFLWTLAGDTILSLIFDKPVQLVGEGYDQTAMKLFSCAVFLVLLYCAIVISSYSAPLIGFGDKISKSNSIFNLASKRSFALFLGGFFVCFGLLIAAITLDSKILVAINKFAERTAHAEKINPGFR